MTEAQSRVDAHPGALSDDFGFLLSRASGVVVAAVNKELVAVGLRVRSYSVLALACEQSEGVNQRRVATMVGLDPSQIVALVDDLESKGLVVRAQDPSDRRNKFIAATDSGRALFLEAQARAHTAHARYFDGIEDETVAQMRNVLRSIAFTDVADR